MGKFDWVVDKTYYLKKYNTLRLRSMLKIRSLEKELTKTLVERDELLVERSNTRKTIVAKNKRIRELKEIIGGK